MIEILSFDNIGDLEKKVNEKIQDGWEVVGYTSAPIVMWNNYLEDNKEFVINYSCMLKTSSKSIIKLDEDKVIVKEENTNER